MVENLRQHHISFKNAFSGLYYSFTTQPNFKIHFFLAASAIIVGFLLGVTFLEMTVLVMTVVFCLGAEMINTAIESITDLVTSDWHQEAKIAKDVSAGMMLLAAFGAVFVAILILGPKILVKL